MCPVPRPSPPFGAFLARRRISEDGGREKEGGAIVRASPSQRRSHNQRLKEEGTKAFGRGFASPRRCAPSGRTLQTLNRSSRSFLFPHLCAHTPVSRVWIANPRETFYVRERKSQPQLCRALRGDLPGSGRAVAATVTNAASAGVALFCVLLLER